MLATWAAGKGVAFMTRFLRYGLIAGLNHRLASTAIGDSNT